MTDFWSVMLGVLIGCTLSFVSFVIATLVKDKKDEREFERRLEQMKDDYYKPVYEKLEVKRDYFILPKRKYNGGWTFIKIPTGNKKENDG